MSAAGEHDVRDAVLTQGTLIDSGAEAELYLFQGAAWKVYYSPIVSERFKLNVAFLMRFSTSGIVPKFGNFHSLKSGIIRMQFLDQTFWTLKKVFGSKSFSSLETRRKLLEQLWKARQKLPMHTQFNDLQNPKNIMVKVDYYQQRTLGVIFIEGGTEHQHPNAAYLFIKAMADFLKLSKDDSFRKIKPVYE